VKNVFLEPSNYFLIKYKIPFDFSLNSSEKTLPFDINKASFEISNYGTRVFKKFLLDILIERLPKLSLSF